MLNNNVRILGMYYSQQFLQPCKKCRTKAWGEREAILGRCLLFFNDATRALICIATENTLFPMLKHHFTHYFTDRTRLYRSVLPKIEKSFATGNRN